MVDQPSKAVARVAALVEQLSRLSRELDLAVIDARDDGASWSDIASMLRCSPQAAHKRFRWARRDLDGAVWREPPLPLTTGQRLSTER